MEISEIIELEKITLVSSIFLQMMKTNLWLMNCRLLLHLKYSVQ